MKNVFLPIVLLLVLSNHLYSQQMSESETVKYLQNTFDNYRISFYEKEESRSYYTLLNVQISYDNPKVTIISDCTFGSFSIRYKLEISFNINDVEFSVKGDELFIRCRSCIAYKKTGYDSQNTFISFFSLGLPEQLIATRLRNAFNHLKSMSGKVKSAPDPFDNPVSSSTPSTTKSTNASTQTRQTNNTSAVPNVVTYTNRQRGFSIDYPKGWEIVERQMQNIQGVAFLAPEVGANFRTNFNVIVSNRTESAEALFQMTQTQNKKNFVGYQLNEKKNVSINGISGIKHVASYKLDVYPVKGIQYTLKKSDNTVYVITFTVGDQFYQKEKNLIENIIIQSFKTL